MDFPLVNKRQWEVMTFDDHPQHDTVWAMATGADGHIYIGLCCEHTGGGVAQLYRYNVQRRKLEHCADMAEVTGEPCNNGHATQGKIHFAICPASDGSLFGSTHCTTPPIGHKFWSAYGAWGDPVLNFPGGHIWRHDPGTGRSVDFGVIFPNEGIPFLLLDESRERLYGVTYPKAHFFRCNLQGRDVVDYGRVSSWYPIGMTFDSKMNLFLGDTNSRLIKFDAEQDKLVFFDSTPFAQPWNRSKRFSWLCNLNLAEDGKIYGTHYCNDHLYRFDPKEKEPKFEDIGAALPGVISGPPRCLLPDGRGHIYWIAFPPGTGYDKGVPVFVRYTIRNGRKDVIGGLKVNGLSLCSWIGALDRDGNIYMKGARTPISIAIYRPND